MIGDVIMDINKKAGKGIKIIKAVFILAFLGTILYLIFGEIFLPSENIEDKQFEAYTKGWVWVKDDGSRIPIEVPAKCDAERNEVVTIENVLPNNLDGHEYLCFRSSKQEMNIYVDGVLRKTYSTKDTRAFGKTSAVTYVFFKLDLEDSGKVVTLETQTDSSYSGIIHSIYLGDRLGIWFYFLRQHGAEMVIGLFMIFLGVISIGGSIALRLCYHKKMELEYLGWGILLAAIWLLANSVFRQIAFQNVSVISDMTFFMIMLMALPFMFYLNGIQNERYQIFYLVSGTVCIIDFFICTILHITNKIDFADTITIMSIVCVISVGIMGMTIIADICRGYIKEYRLVAIGILGVSLTAIIQIIMYFQRTIPFNGSMVALGLVFLLIISSINTINDVLNIEKEKQQAVLSNESKGRFLARMSHEIRTPINSILGMDAIILRECEDTQIKEYAIDIQNAGQTLLSLINDILDFSKIESGKMEIIPVEYDFSSMLNDIVNMILIKAQAKDLEMNIFVEQTLPFKLFGDEVRIRQILLNLLTNAVKYTHKGSVTLTVKGKLQKDTVLLEFAVEDTGIGIKEEDISKLYEEFERIEEKRNRDIEGSGLGMNITMQLLEMMGSRLNVESQYGKGSKFSFELEQKIINREPIGNLEERIRRLPMEYNYAATFVAPEAEILVVDDNAINRKVFINLLKETKTKIDEASSGRKCLEKIREKKFDLIFLDHMMPEMDGIETLHHIKEETDHLCNGIPVIALTANAIAGAKEMYMSEGFDDFISKPIKPDKLEKMIVQFLPKEKILKETRVEEKDNKRIEAQFFTIINDEELPDIDGIDWNYALNNLSDKKLLLDTVRDFYRMIDIEANYLEDCFEQIENGGNEIELYRIKVHAMKSSAAMIGAVMLSGMAKTLEYAARDGKMEIIEGMTGIFLEEWREYKEKLKVCIKEDEKKDIEDISVINNLCEVLIVAMDDMDIDTADRTMNQLREYKYSNDIQILIELLSGAVTDLDHKKVFMLAEEIRTRIEEGVI